MPPPRPVPVDENGDPLTGEVRPRGGGDGYTPAPGGSAGGWGQADPRGNNPYGGGNWWGNLRPPAPPPGYVAPPAPKKDTYWEDYFRNQFGNYSPLPSYQTAQQDEARRLQQQTIQDLQTVAAGSMGTRAQKELAAQNKMGQQSQYALTSGQRGGDMRAAQRGAGQVASQLAGQQNVLKLQEQQAAQALLSQMLAQQQAQDITLAGDQSQYDLRGRALEDAFNQFMLGQGASRELGLTQLQHDRNLMQAGLDLDSNSITKDWIDKGMQSGATALSTLGQMNWGNSSSGDGGGYRQVDGRNSIVPRGDK